ncbi:uncharacterized protein JCM15063_001043 [Sporobolomyces koalae]|uniref:uncharacterized protein n=1 Tax=Sporobolomyces koalae TaxID=500713 RepID=UPI00317C2353
MFKHRHDWARQVECKASLLEIIWETDSVDEQDKLVLQQQVLNTAYAVRAERHNLEEAFKLLPQVQVMASMFRLTEAGIPKARLEEAIEGYEVVPVSRQLQSIWCRMIRETDFFKRWDTLAPRSQFYILAYIQMWLATWTYDHNGQPGLSGQKSPPLHDFEILVEWRPSVHEGNSQASSQVHGGPEQHQQQGYSGQEWSPTSRGSQNASVLCGQW